MARTRSRGATVDAEFISHLPRFKRNHARAVVAGLRAAAQVVVNEVRRNLRGGYTSGAFATGISLSAVRFSDVILEYGVPTIRIGSHLLYNLYWELGHMSIYTRKFERVEVWVPAFLDTRDQQARAFAAAYKRTMRQAA